MSRQYRINASAAEPADTNDIHLHIDLRLDRETIAEALVAEEQGRRQPATATQLREVACRIYNARRIRDRMIDNDLFGEPAWDMLLTLYCAEASGERVSITSLSLASAAPQTSGLRWQSILAERGLIERRRDSSDGRRQFVHLTDTGRHLLESYLTRLSFFDMLASPRRTESGT